jgi:hypothetical protein
MIIWKVAIICICLSAESLGSTSLDNNKRNAGKNGISRPLRKSDENILVEFFICGVH